MTPRLDYVPRLDYRNRDYRVAAPAADLSGVARWWTGGTVLDQGAEGSCVGHGVVGEYLASPVRGRFNAIRDLWPSLGHDLAVAVYRRAKEIDEWEGVDYDGTSVRAGMLVARERGWIEGFRWAFRMTELRAALEDGPVVIGVDWRESMYETRANGDVVVAGDSVGGHCLLVTGYSPNYDRRGPRYRWRNSWGLEYGHGTGNGYIRPDDLQRVLFGTGGEAAVPVARHL